MTWWEKNSDWAKWVVGIVISLAGTGGLGTLIAKGLTANAKEEVRIEYQKKIDDLRTEKNNYIRILENEVDDLQLDVVTVGFKYDMCCSTSPNCN